MVSTAHVDANAFSLEVLGRRVAFGLKGVKLGDVALLIGPVPLDREQGLLLRSHGKHALEMDVLPMVGEPGHLKVGNVEAEGDSCQRVSRVSHPYSWCTHTLVGIEPLITFSCE